MARQIDRPAPPLRRQILIACIVAAMIWWTIPGNAERPSPPPQDPVIPITEFEARLPACPSCSIVAESLVTLEMGPDSGVYEGWSISVAHSSTGIFYASRRNYRDPRVMVFDSAGRAQSSFGGKEPGPGTYYAIEGLMMGRRDSVLVLDRGARAVSVVSPGGVPGRRLRTGPIRNSVDVDELVSARENGEIIVIGVELGNIDAGPRLFVINSSDERPRAIGPRSLTWGTTSHTVERHATVASNSMIWLSDADYRLELLDSLGTVVKNVGVRSPIFPSPVWTRRQVDSAEAAYRLARDTRGADGRPRTRWIHRPELAQLQSDARGQLWVLLHLPSPDSVHVPPMPSSKRPSGDVTLAEIDSYHQTRIDLLDPTHGRLIAWTTLPGRWSFSGPSEIMRMTPTPDGRIVANVRQLRLAGSYTRLLGW